MESLPQEHNNNHFQNKKTFSNLQKSHQEELATITNLLIKITNLEPEQIQPQLEIMLSKLLTLDNQPFYKTATKDEWIKQLQLWSESHRHLSLPSLSDYAVSREGIYSDENL